MKRLVKPVLPIFALLLLLIVGIQAPAFLAAAAEPGEEVEVDIQTAPGGLAIALRFPDFTTSRLPSGGAHSDRIAFPGQSGTTGDPGAPELPFYSLLVAAPDGARPVIEALQFQSRIEQGTYDLAPAPVPAALGEDLTPGELARSPSGAYYESAALYPAEVVQIQGEAWIRGQRILRIAVYPYQYSAAGQQLTANEGISFRIAFTGGDTANGCPDCRFDDALESALRTQIVNYEQGLAWRVRPGSEALESQIQSPGPNPFLGPRFEIVVKADGIYHLTYADMQAAGMDVDNVNPQSFRLVNQGRDIAIFVQGEGDAGFDPGDFIAFYGERFRGDVLEDRYQSTMTKPSYDPENQSLAPNNWFWQCLDSCELASYFERYTEENIYYLLSGGTPGPRMSQLNGAPGGAAIATTFMSTVRAEVPIHWWSHEWYDDDVWFWKRIQNFNPHDFPITLTNVAAVGGSASITVEMSARNHNELATPDHHSKLSLNGVQFDDHFWDGRIRYAFTGTVPQAQLLEGTNTLTVQLFNDGLQPFPDLYFDFFEITYARGFAALNDELNFKRSQSGTWRFQVTGLASGSVEVYRISDPVNPIRITGAAVSGGGPFTATFQVTDGASSQYIVAGTGTGVRTPESITFYDPPDFENMAEAEYVLITHANFLAATQTLANFRSSQGYSVAVIDVDDLYHEFNDGIYHPIAIKNFLAWTFSNWSNPVEYAVLVGSGNWNMRNFGDGTIPQYHNAPPTYMPPNLAYVDPWQGEVDSANLLATIIGDDTVPDVYISRIPAKTNAEMAIVVGKIIAYENAANQDWNRNFMFIADTIPDTAGNFVALSDGIIEDYIDPNPAYTAQRIYLNDFGCVSSGSAQCDNVTQAIIDTLDGPGSLLVNYLGHAALDRWTGESVWLNSDVASLNNPTQLPFVLSMTCLDGHWTYPNLSSMVYTMLVANGKGMVGSFSATGLGVATGHDPLHRGFYDSLMADDVWQAGPAASSAKLSLWATGFNQDLAQTFMVFGDAALGFKNGFGVTLTPEMSSKTGAPGTNAIHTLTIKNVGSIIDSYTIEVAGGGWNATPSTTTVGPLNPNQSVQIQITVAIPGTAEVDEMSTSIVTARSQSALHVSASSQVKTTAAAATATFTPTSTATASPTPTATFTPTATATGTSPSPTPTATPTFTPTPTGTPVGDHFIYLPIAIRE